MRGLRLRIGWRVHVHRTRTPTRRFCEETDAVAEQCSGTMLPSHELVGRCGWVRGNTNTGWRRHESRASSRFNAATYNNPPTVVCIGREPRMCVPALLQERGPGAQGKSYIRQNEECKKTRGPTTIVSTHPTVCTCQYLSFRCSSRGRRTFDGK